mmetsp:Transcript_4258/g.8938  ORF Transcript_4258/g.8938 Transcript_4258/m.8938 type:complete len:854 (+) Transcript_4258:255-2816(+)|eukprot:CAMPEP_0168845518 /NCGR_PEP_ID=MMETSP0727-20121128/9316_1 /TAXON_ID=265536 /ORGANISM="Amphiprora sp., Strain CCMP467" /LENGTH=853 /DNA_ID=CAMNT_0008899239 /DNA_START=1654 /DNA_END=4215 /DNA_ORIENTATION=+
MNMLSSSDDEKSYDYTGVLDGFYSNDEGKDPREKGEQEEQSVLSHHDSMGSGVFGSKVDLFAIFSDTDTEPEAEHETKPRRKGKIEKERLSETVDATATNNENDANQAGPQEGKADALEGFPSLKNEASSKHSNNYNLNNDTSKNSKQHNLEKTPSFDNQDDQAPPQPTISPSSPSSSRRKKRRPSTSRIAKDANKPSKDRSSSRPKRSNSSKPAKDRSNSRPKQRSSSTSRLNKERGESKAKNKQRTRSGSRNRNSLRASQQSSSMSTRSDAKLRSSDSKLLGSRSTGLGSEIPKPDPINPQQRTVSDPPRVKRRFSNRRSSYSGSSGSFEGIPEIPSGRRLSLDAADPHSSAVVVQRVVSEGGEGGQEEEFERPPIEISHRSKSMSEIALVDEAIIKEAIHGRSNSLRSLTKTASSDKSSRPMFSRSSSGKSFKSTSTENSNRITRTFRRTSSGRSIPSNPSSKSRSIKSNKNATNDSDDDHLEKEEIKRELRAMLESQLSKRLSDDETGSAIFREPQQPEASSTHPAQPQRFQFSREEPDLANTAAPESKEKKPEKKRKKRRRKKSRRKKLPAPSKQFILMSEPNLSLPTGGLCQEVKADSDISSSSYTDSDYSSYSSEEDEDEEDEVEVQRMQSTSNAQPTRMLREQSLDDVFMASQESVDEVGRSKAKMEDEILPRPNVDHDGSPPPREPALSIPESLEPVQKLELSNDQREQSSGAEIRTTLQYHKVVRFLGELARNMNKTNMISLATPVAKSEPGQQQREARAFYVDQVEPHLIELREVTKDLKRQVMSVCESIAQNNRQGHSLLNEALEEERVNLMASIDQVQNLDIELRILLDDIHDHVGGGIS